MLNVENLGLSLGAFALEGVSFRVEAGDYYVLLGASGAGKTVLLETLAGFLESDTGTIALDGHDVTRTPIQARRMALVHQDPALFPHMTVARNIAYGLRVARGVEAKGRVEALAAEVGVGDLLDRFPGTLSGGEKQRVALARALATSPRCLLLDEPLSSLDVEARASLRALLRRLHRAGHTIIHVTHHYEEAVALATRVGIIENGAIAEEGDPEHLFHHPKSEFGARFVGIRNVFRGTLSRHEADGAVARFATDGITIAVVSDGAAGLGSVLLRSEDITLSNACPKTSARNMFPGTIRDLAPSRRGIEVTVDVGVEMVAIVTRGSVSALGLRCGNRVWVSFKATAARFIEG